MRQVMQKLLWAIALSFGVAATAFAPSSTAYETIAGVTGVSVRDDPSLPQAGYWTPTYVDETTNDISYWILIAKRQRSTGVVTLSVNFEFHHREKQPRQITSVTPDGDVALVCGPIKSDKSCTPTCEYTENVVIGLSPVTLKALTGRPLRIKIDTAKGWSKTIEFSDDIIRELIDKAGI
jgi:hypothetical protein